AGEGEGRGAVLGPRPVWAGRRPGSALSWVWSLRWSVRVQTHILRPRNGSTNGAQAIDLPGAFIESPAPARRDGTEPGTNSLDAFPRYPLLLGRPGMGVAPYPT